MMRGGMDIPMEPLHWVVVEQSVPAGRLEQPVDSFSKIASVMDGTPTSDHYELSVEDSA